MDFSWSSILSHSLLVVLRVLGEPFFWIVVVLVWTQYRRMLKTKESIYGRRDSSLRVSLIALVYGVIGGFLGSFLMIIFGVTINGIGVAWLWVIALLLMLISPRLLCFSYAGGILAVISLLFGYPQVNVPGLMGLVAVLHLVESILILLSGGQEPLPVYVRNPAGRVVGAFNLQKFWPIPLAVMMILLGAADQTAGEMIKMPQWWPLIRPWDLAAGREPAYQILPVVAALGYGELAVTCLPRERTRRSAAHLACYSIILLGLAVVASHFPRLAVIPALFSPLGHELLVFLGRREELQGKPRFVPPAAGVMILDVFKGSPAHLAGIKSGDIILSVDGLSVNSRYELSQMLRLAGDSFMAEISNENGITRQIRVRREAGPHFGEITVPEPGDYPNVDFVMGSPLKNLIRRFRSR
jgi:hypothetical protein